jgi:hypothetical protein
VSARDVSAIARATVTLVLANPMPVAKAAPDKSLDSQTGLKSSRRHRRRRGDNVGPACRPITAEADVRGARAKAEGRRQGCRPGRRMKALTAENRLKSHLPRPVPMAMAEALVPRRRRHTSHFIPQAPGRVRTLKVFLRFAHMGPRPGRSPCTRSRTSQRVPRRSLGTMPLREGMAQRYIAICCDCKSSVVAAVTEIPNPVGNRLISKVLISFDEVGVTFSPTPRFPVLLRSREARP